MHEQRDGLRIFLSYRRDDAAGHAGRLHDALTSRFGAGRVFMDVATIQPGADWLRVIDEAVTSCDVLVAVIGQGWHSRIHEPDDVVRLEVATALEHDVRVIPVLVQATAPPAAEDLPEQLAELTRRNALELSDSR
jgi:hypothetical protein